MIKEIVNLWEENKHRLEDYFRSTLQNEYDQYEVIVKKIFELIVNSEKSTRYKFDVHKMTIINDGDYQGTLIFIVSKSTYQPDAEEYLVTDTYYGSCSGCDTLLTISEYSDRLPSDEQVREYMTLALHLVQKTRWLFTAEE